MTWVRASLRPRDFPLAPLRLSPWALPFTSLPGAVPLSSLPGLSPTALCTPRLSLLVLAAALSPLLLAALGNAAGGALGQVQGMQLPPSPPSTGHFQEASWCPMLALVLPCCGACRPCSWTWCPPLYPPAFLRSCAWAAFLAGNGVSDV